MSRYYPIQSFSNEYCIIIGILDISVCFTALLSLSRSIAFGHTVRYDRYQAWLGLARVDAEHIEYRTECQRVTNWIHNIGECIYWRFKWERDCNTRLMDEFQVNGEKGKKTNGCQIKPIRIIHAGIFSARICCFCHRNVSPF